jgi:hypothetical protein
MPTSFESMSIPTSIPSTSLGSPLIVIRPASLFETTTW